MDGAVQCQFGHDGAGLQWLAESSEEEGHVDVWLIALVVQLLVKELVQLCSQRRLAAQRLHAAEEHRGAPAVLPARALIEPVAPHLGVGLVNVHELLRPDRVEKLFAPFLPSGSILGISQFGSQLAQCPEVAGRLETLVWLGQGQPHGLSHHSGIGWAQLVGRDNVLTQGIEQRGDGMLGAHGGHTLEVGGPVLLACDVQLGKRAHDVVPAPGLHEQNQGELGAVRVPQRPGTVILESTGLMYTPVRT